MAHSDGMLTVSPPHPSRRRRHRRPNDAPLEHADRRALEQAGWRTLLEYRENHRRADDGTLLSVVTEWTGEAELGACGGRGTGRALVVSATAATPDAVWAHLRRMTAEVTDFRSTRALHARL